MTYQVYNHLQKAGPSIWELQRKRYEEEQAAAAQSADAELTTTTSTTTGTTQPSSDMYSVYADPSMRASIKAYIPPEWKPNETIHNYGSKNNSLRVRDQNTRFNQALKTAKMTEDQWLRIPFEIKQEILKDYAAQDYSLLTPEIQAAEGNVDKYTKKVLKAYGVADNDKHHDGMFTAAGDVLTETAGGAVRGVNQLVSLVDEAANRLGINMDWGVQKLLDKGGQALKNLIESEDYDGQVKYLEYLIDNDRFGEAFTLAIGTPTVGAKVLGPELASMLVGTKGLGTVIKGAKAATAATVGANNVGRAQKMWNYISTLGKDGGKLASAAGAPVRVSANLLAKGAEYRLVAALQEAGGFRLEQYLNGVDVTSEDATNAFELAMLQQYFIQGIIPGTADSILYKAMNNKGVSRGIVDKTLNELRDLISKADEGSIIKRFNNTLQRMGGVGAALRVGSSMVKEGVEEGITSGYQDLLGQNLDRIKKGEAAKGSLTASTVMDGDFDRAMGAAKHGAFVGTLMGGGMHYFGDAGRPVQEYKAAKATVESIEKAIADMDQHNVTNFTSGRTIAQIMQDADAFRAEIDNNDFTNLDNYESSITEIQSRIADAMRTVAQGDLTVEQMNRAITFANENTTKVNEMMDVVAKARQTQSANQQASSPGNSLQGKFNQFAQEAMNLASKAGYNTKTKSQDPFIADLDKKIRSMVDVNNIPNVEQWVNNAKQSPIYANDPAAQSLIDHVQAAVDWAKNPTPPPAQPQPTQQGGLTPQQEAENNAIMVFKNAQKNHLSKLPDDVQWLPDVQRVLQDKTATYNDLGNAISRQITEWTNQSQTAQQGNAPDLAGRVTSAARDLSDLRAILQAGRSQNGDPQAVYDNIITSRNATLFQDTVSAENQQHVDDHRRKAEEKRKQLDDQLKAVQVAQRTALFEQNEVALNGWSDQVNTILGDSNFTVPKEVWRGKFSDEDGSGDVTKDEVADRIRKIIEYFRNVVSNDLTPTRAQKQQVSRVQERLGSALNDIIDGHPQYESFAMPSDLRQANVDENTRKAILDLVDAMAYFVQDGDAVMRVRGTGVGLGDVLTNIINATRGGNVALRGRAGDSNAVKQSIVDAAVSLRAFIRDGVPFSLNVHNAELLGAALHNATKNVTNPNAKLQADAQTKQLLQGTQDVIEQAPIHTVQQSMEFTLLEMINAGVAEMVQQNHREAGEAIAELITNESNVSKELLNKQAIAEQEAERLLRTYVGQKQFNPSDFTTSDTYPDFTSELFYGEMARASRQQADETASPPVQEQRTADTEIAGSRGFSFVPVDEITTPAPTARPETTKREETDTENRKKSEDLVLSRSDKTHRGETSTPVSDTLYGKNGKPKNELSPSDVQKFIQNQGVPATLQELKKGFHTNDPRQAVLDGLIDIVDDSVIVRFEDLSAQGRTGYYDVATNTITLDYTSREMDIDLIHELTHAYTVYAIENYDALTKEQKAVVDEIRGAWEATKADPEFAQKFPTILDPQTGIHEFVAEAMSNPEFQFMYDKKFANKAPEGFFGSIRAFFRRVAELLGLAPKNHPDLFQLIRNTSSILAPNDGRVTSIEGLPELNRKVIRQVIFANRTQEQGRDQSYAAMALEEDDGTWSLNWTDTQGVQTSIDGLTYQQVEEEAQRRNFVPKARSTASSTQKFLLDVTDRAFNHSGLLYSLFRGIQKFLPEKIAEPVLRKLDVFIRWGAVNMNNHYSWITTLENLARNAYGANIPVEVETRINRIKQRGAAELEHYGVGGKLNFRDHMEIVADLARKSGLSKERVDDIAYALRAPHFIRRKQRNSGKDDPYYHGRDLLTGTVSGFFYYDSTGKRVPDDDGSKFMATLSPQERIFAKEFEKAIIAMNNNTLDFQLAMGSIDQDTYNDLYGEFYVPLQSGQTEARAFAGRVKGRTTKADNILSRYVANSQARINQAVESAIMKEAADLIADYPMPHMVRLQSDELRTMSDKTHLVYAPEGVLDGRSRAFYIDGKRSRIVFEDKVFARALHKANALEREGMMASFLRGFGTVTRTLALSRTVLSPMFHATAFMRDMSAVIVNTQAASRGKLSDAEAATLSARTLKSMLTWLPKIAYGQVNEKGADFAYRVFTNEGGINPMAHYDLDKVSGDLDLLAFNSGTYKAKAVTGVRKAMKIMHFSDNAARFASWYEYLKMQNGGRDFTSERDLLDFLARNQEIADIARDISKNITGNFEQKGASNTPRALFMFWNAIMGGIKTSYNILNPKYGTYGIKSFAMLMLLVMLQEAGDDEEDEDGTPMHKHTNEGVSQFHIGPLKFNVAQEISYGLNAGRSFVRLMKGDYTVAEAAEKTMRGLQESIFPFQTPDTDDMLFNVLYGFSPTAVQPAVALLANKNYFGRKVAPENGWGQDGSFIADPMDHQRRNLSDSNWSQWLTFKLAELGIADVAPSTFDTVVNHFIGTGGKFVTDIAEAMRVEGKSPLTTLAEMVDKKFTVGYNDHAFENDFEKEYSELYRRMSIGSSYDELLNLDSVGERKELTDLKRKLTQKVRELRSSSGRSMGELFTERKQLELQLSPPADDILELNAEIAELQEARKSLYLDALLKLREMADEYTEY